MDNIIEVKHLVKKFGDFTAVDDISFNVKKGEIFAFLGPNGAGKSTTIKMLTTILNPTSGTITLNGHDTAKDADAVRHSFGIVFRIPVWTMTLPRSRIWSFMACCTVFRVKLVKSE